MDDELRDDDPVGVSDQSTVADDDDDEDEDAAMAVLETYDTEAEALEDARLLVENGIGATVVEITVAPPEGEGPPQGTFRIEVLPIDVRRSERVLGFIEESDYDPNNPPKLEKGKTPWKVLLLIWLAAMIIIPVLAFFLTYNMAAK